MMGLLTKPTFMCLEKLLHGLESYDFDSSSCNTILTFFFSFINVIMCHVEIVLDNDHAVIYPCTQTHSKLI